VLSLFPSFLPSLSHFGEEPCNPSSPAEQLAGEYAFFCPPRLPAHCILPPRFLGCMGFTAYSVFPFFPLSSPLFSSVVFFVDGDFHQAHLYSSPHAPSVGSNLLPWLSPDQPQSPPPSPSRVSSASLERSFSFHLTRGQCSPFNGPPCDSSTPSPILLHRGFPPLTPLPSFHFPTSIETLFLPLDQRLFVLFYSVHFFVLSARVSAPTLASLFSFFQ